jgi:hypothetical protein
MNLEEAAILMNEKAQALPPINQMGLSEATESFIWSIFDDGTTMRIIAAHIKEKDDKIARLKGQRDQAVEALGHCLLWMTDNQNKRQGILSPNSSGYSRLLYNAEAAIAVTEDDKWPG